MHVVHARISGDVRLRDNKGTPNILEDDLLIGPMPYVEYDEPSLQIRSDSDVVIQDRDMRITGFGLRILLRPREEGGPVRVQRGEDRDPEEERPHRHPGRRPVGGPARQGHGPAGADGPDAARPALPGADADRPARAEAPRPRRATRPAGPHVRQLLARRPRPARQRRPAPRPARQRPPAPDPLAGRETRRARRRGRDAARRSHGQGRSGRAGRRGRPDDRAGASRGQGVGPRRLAPVGGPGDQGQVQRADLQEAPPREARRDLPPGRRDHEALRREAGTRRRRAEEGPDRVRHDHPVDGRDPLRRRPGRRPEHHRLARPRAARDPPRPRQARRAHRVLGRHARDGRRGRPRQTGPEEDHPDGQPQVRRHDAGHQPRGTQAGFAGSSSG